MPHNKKSHILVVDDEQDWCDRIQSYLGDEYHIDSAQDYEKAVELLKLLPFDLAVINVLLRGEIDKYWRVGWTDLLDLAVNKKTNVIVITSMERADGKIGILETALEYGVKKVFFKTEISKREFLEKVKEIVSMKEEPSNLSSIDSTDFDIFLACNDEDKLEVRTIANKLKRRGFNPWFYDEQIHPGQSFQEVIQQAIRNVKSVAIFIGKSGLGKWQNVELKTSITRFVEEGISIIPVLLPGVTRIPDTLPFLKELKWVSFAKEIADPEALDQLVWGITGKKPNKK